MATKATPETRKALAAPTKRLLVDVLTKDIDLVAAVLDLIDNSVDGARRLRGAQKLDGLKITVTFGKQEFVIDDNCGGISLEEAETRAFCFGPDDADPPDPFSTGQFGVGMKRALFKLGRSFSVSSTSAADSFEMDVNVPEWLGAPDWTFDLDDVETGLSNPKEDRGTTITVKPLHKTIAKELGRSTLQTELKEQTAQRHQLSLARGLEIQINGTAMKAQEQLVVADKNITPAVIHRSLNGSEEAVDVKLVCGVIPHGKPRDAGWSVFLNDRAVLLADRSEATGWGEQDETRIPRFHNQYGRFRGYAFLSCEDTTRLPWNTTKTGLDGDDDVYRTVRALMVDAADPVVDFLDAIKKERGVADDFGTLRKSVDDGKTKSVQKLAKGPEAAWSAPEVIPPPPPPETTRVYTDQPVDLVEAVKAELGATSNVEAGDLLFEYFIEREF